MKAISAVFVMVLLTLPIASQSQEVAGFYLPDSDRPFLFVQGPRGGGSRSLAGMRTILVKRFETKPQADKVVLTFFDSIVCEVHHKSVRDNGGGVMVVGEMIQEFPSGARILFNGREMKPQDLKMSLFTNPKNNETRPATGSDALPMQNTPGIPVPPPLPKVLPAPEPGPGIRK